MVDRIRFSGDPTVKLVFAPDKKVDALSSQTVYAEYRICKRNVWYTSRQIAVRRYPMIVWLSHAVAQIHKHIIHVPASSQKLNILVDRIDVIMPFYARILVKLTPATHLNHSLFLFNNETVVTNLFVFFWVLKYDALSWCKKRLIPRRELEQWVDYMCRTTEFETVSTHSNQFISAIFSEKV